MFDETGDAAKSQGWTAFVLDTNGNGKRDAYVEPNQPLDPTKDKRIAGGFYAVMPNPVDGSIWGTVGAIPRRVVRVAPGSQSAGDGARGNLQRADAGLRHRAAAISTARASSGCRSRSGHMGSFDRQQMQRAAQRPEGHRRPLPGRLVVLSVPGPGFQGIGENSAESSYYTWVDQHNTFGLGEDVPMSTGNLNDGLVA